MWVFLFEVFFSKLRKKNESDRLILLYVLKEFFC